MPRAAAISVAALFLSGCSYNQLASQDQAVKAEWVQVQRELQKRDLLISRLVDSLKVDASRAQAALQAAIDSRAQLAAARTTAETIDAANRQSIALARLVAIVENDPQLKATDSVRRVMDESRDIENRLAVGRMRYNGFVQQYNQIRRRFPGVRAARALNFRDYPFFEVPAGREAQAAGVEALP